MTATDAQLATLVATTRSLHASLYRINVVESPRAWHLAQDSLREHQAATRQALRMPLQAGTGWRRVQLSGGRLAEVFNSGGGTTFALRNTEAKPGQPYTLRSWTGDAGKCLRMLEDEVFADLATNH
jgi:hypothetical protein